MINASKYYKKFQQGGQVDPMQQLQALVQAAMSGDQQAAQQIDQIMQAAQQGDPQAQQLAQAIQQIAQQLQGQPQMAKRGSKLQKKDWLKNGSKVTKNAAGGRPCNCATLHRVGGRIVERPCYD